MMPDATCCPTVRTFRSSSEFYKAERQRVEQLEAGRTSALCDVLAERQSQDAKWGVQNHESAAWLAILMEEVGELAQAVLEAEVFDNGRRGEFTLASVREEAVQCAAVALAFVECIDRAYIAEAAKEETL